MKQRILFLNSLRDFHFTFEKNNMENILIMDFFLVKWKMLSKLKAVKGQKRDNEWMELALRYFVLNRLHFKNVTNSCWKHFSSEHFFLS